MAGEIKRIDSIKNMAIFQDFCWVSSVKDKGNNILEFKKINILYGRNYSGKTTLSRIFRAMETGILSDKYIDPKFQLTLDNNTKVTQDSLISHGQVIRVFNEDFVKENLRFIIDDQHAINSFAILGANNAMLEEEIKKLEMELGSEEDKSGLMGKMAESNRNYDLKKETYNTKESVLENRLRAKANNPGTGIKHNKTFGDSNYNVSKIKIDIEKINDESYKQLKIEQIDQFRTLLKEEPKLTITESVHFNLAYLTLAAKTKELIEKKIQISDPIKELVNNAILETWVRNGRELHKEKRSQCAFCGSELPITLWETLDKHFNKESEELRIAIKNLLNAINNEMIRVPNLLKINISDFYSTYSSDIEILRDQFAMEAATYVEALKFLQHQLNQRENDIFSSLRFVEPISLEHDLYLMSPDQKPEKGKIYIKNANEALEYFIIGSDGQLQSNKIIKDELGIDISEQINIEKLKPNILKIISKRNHIPSVDLGLTSIRDLYEKLRNQSNEFTASLSAKQSKARIALRLHEVFTFINDIKYNDECEEIKNLKESMQNAEKKKTDIQIMINRKKKSISELKAQLKDESKGADRVNDYLNNFFGHQSLSLKAIENSSDRISTGYRFEVIRDNKKAFHLSEGECSLIAFCYFMAKLEDVETKGTQPIIWIDDPISSLDANHIFFVFSLINVEIVKSQLFKQLFISTHNLEFLKYLKKISTDYKGKGENKIKVREFFLIERRGSSSHLSLMPEYLKNYVTEFNYLFHQIYKCATIDVIDDKNYQDFYNFGNNARKFLEIYLYYKYPNGVDGDDKLLKFFNDQKIPTILIDRVNNEYSHLCGIFERRASPVDTPEVKTIAKQILEKIKEDPDQYSALLQSIDVKEEVY